MTPTKFARCIARIQHDRGRTDHWRKRAIARLVAAAGALVIAKDGRPVRYQLATGAVCVKQRYRDAIAANDDLWRIQRMPGENVKPIRAYRCPHCHGFHLTHQQR